MSGYDESSVVEFFDGLCKAWETNDGAELAKRFTDDGSLINPFGERADGRAAVSAMYTDYFSGLLAGTTSTFRLETVRAIDTDHVLTDGEQVISGPDGSAVLVVHLTALLRRVDGEWLTVDARPYALAEIPG